MDYVLSGELGLCAAIIYIFLFPELRCFLDILLFELVKIGNSGQHWFMFEDVVIILC